MLKCKAEVNIVSNFSLFLYTSIYVPSIIATITVANNSLQQQLPQLCSFLIIKIYNKLRYCDIELFFSLPIQAAKKNRRRNLLSLTLKLKSKLEAI